MIRVSLEKDAQGLIRRCEAKGHSDWAEEGRDIVCAGASILMTTCVNSLEAVCGIIPVVETNSSGHMAFHLPDGLTQAQRHDAAVLMGALRQGLLDLSDAYPKDVKLAYMNGGNHRDQA